MTEEQIDNMLIRMVDPKNGIEIGVHKRNFKTYPDSFTGEDACRWIANALNLDKESAIQYGQTMFMNRGIFYSLSKKHSSFHDKADVLYKFRVSTSHRYLKRVSLSNLFSALRY